MKKIVISTIVRDGEKTAQDYYNSIKLLTENKNYKFYLSLLENDSKDKTKDLLENYDWGFIEHIIKFDTTGDKKYGSVIKEERVKNLSIARNKTIEYAEKWINEADFVLLIDFDIHIDADNVFKMIEHEKYMGFKCDLFSGLSLSEDGAGSEVKKGLRFYDCWALRRDHVETWGDIFSDWQENPIREIWSNCSGIVLYNAEVFKSGVRFGYINHRLNHFDCDTVVVAEEMRTKGFNKIYVDQSCHFLHS